MAPPRAQQPGLRPGREAHLDSVLHVGGLMDTALAHGVGAHTDRLLYHVAIAKNQVLPMELLQKTNGWGCPSALERRGHPPVPMALASGPQFSTVYGHAHWLLHMERSAALRKLGRPEGHRSPELAPSSATSRELGQVASPFWAVTTHLLTRLKVLRH